MRISPKTTTERNRCNLMERSVSRRERERERERECVCVCVCVCVRKLPANGLNKTIVFVFFLCFGVADYSWTAESQTKAIGHTIHKRGNGPDPFSGHMGAILCSRVNSRPLLLFPQLLAQMAPIRAKQVTGGQKSNKPINKIIVKKKCSFDTKPNYYLSKSA